MKYIYILIILTTLANNIFAQRTHTTAHTINTTIENRSLARTTAIGDTLVMKNTTSTDTIALYYVGTGDSGYSVGTNYHNDLGFAERYTINGNDSSVIVLGVIAQFGGVVSASSTKTVVFRVWNEGLPVIVSSNLIYDGFPGDIIDSVVVPVTQLGIGTITDTMKLFLFPDSTYSIDYNSFKLSQNFYVGYNINYNFNTLNGDTIGLASTLNGERMTPADTIEQFINASGDTLVDTIIYVQNCSQYADFTWHDNYTDNDSLFNDLIIYPVVKVDSATFVKGITKRSLTLFGIFPNPSSNEASVKFSVNTTTDITIQLFDMNGGIVYTTQNCKMSIGEHIVPLPVNQLRPGTFTCLVHTATGDGLATQMVVVK